MTNGGGAERSLLAAHRFLRRGPVSEEGWSQLVAKDRDWERSYRGRWAHDKVVRSTHGVNCTGSCSWNVFVKDGIVTWESLGFLLLAAVAVASLLVLMGFARPGAERVSPAGLGTPGPAVTNQ